MPRGRKPGTILVPLEQRFWAKVRKTGTCWIWTGCVMSNGYGSITDRARATRSPSVLVHRLSWELAYGDVPRGLCVLHRCDVRVCVRPDHLFLGTLADNCRDRTAKGRTAKSEDNRHAKLRPEDVISIRAAAREGCSERILARRYGVNHSTIHRIATRQSWTDIEARTKP